LRRSSLWLSVHQKPVILRRSPRHKRCSRITRKRGGVHGQGCQGSCTAIRTSPWCFSISYRYLVRKIVRSGCVRDQIQCRDHGSRNLCPGLPGTLPRLHFVCAGKSSSRCLGKTMSPPTSSSDLGRTIHAWNRVWKLSLRQGLSPTSGRSRHILFVKGRSW
jgi:hypothetical protein